MNSLHPPCSTRHLAAAARSILGLVAFLASLQPAAALACNVPVFRYALEKWRPDAYELVIFRDLRLTAEQAAAVEAIRGQSVAQGGHGNLAVTMVDVNAIEHEAIQKIWDGQKETPARDSLPWLVLRTPVDSPVPATLWAGKLTDFDPKAWLESPARSELSKRLLTGDSIVWVLIPGTDEVAAKTLREALPAWLKRLETELKLPDGIGEPGSEIESPLPVAIRFSIVEVARDNPLEQSFLRELLQVAPDLAESDQPLLIPVFGTGRALDVLSDNELEEKTIEQAAKFLCGACSCVVKEQNPGFDLLLKADWDSIFAAGAPRLARETKHDRPKEAEYVPIPTGVPQIELEANRPGSPYDHEVFIHDSYIRVTPTWGLVAIIGVAGILMAGGVIAGILIASRAQNNPRAPR